MEMIKGKKGSGRNQKDGKNKNNERENKFERNENERKSGRQIGNIISEKNE